MDLHVGSVAIWDPYSESFGPAQKRRVGRVLNGYRNLVLGLQFS